MSPEEIIHNRHSVRAYRPEQIAPAMLDALKAVVADANSHGTGLHFQLVTDDGAPFQGFARSYGMFRGVTNYLAAVIDTNFPTSLEEAGYYAELFALKCVEIGLGSCFVGGTFSSSHVKVQMRVGWRIPFIVAFGFPEESRTSLVSKTMASLAHRKKMSPQDFYDGPIPLAEAEKICPILARGLDAVACAPSSLNKRPVRLCLNGEALLAHVPDYEKQAVDLGIAKCNVAYVIPEGAWEFGPDGVFLL